MAKPKLATAEQFKKAREELGFTQSEVQTNSGKFGLIVDSSNLSKIERGEAASPPTRTGEASGVGTDFKCKGKFAEVLLYEQRLHLFYQLKGIVFLEDGEKIIWVNPANLWGHLQNLNPNYSEVLSRDQERLKAVDLLGREPESYDPARKLIDDAIRMKA